MVGEISKIGNEAWRNSPKTAPVFQRALTPAGHFRTVFLLSTANLFGGGATQRRATALPRKNRGVANN